MKKHSRQQDDGASTAVCIACFFGALFLGAVGGVMSVLIFAFAAAQAILNKSPRPRGRSIALSALVGSGLPLLGFILSKL
jgi:hypothetical protein